MRLALIALWCVSHLASLPDTGMRCCLWIMSGFWWLTYFGVTIAVLIYETTLKSQALEFKDEKMWDRYACGDDDKFSLNWTDDRTAILEEAAGGAGSAFLVSIIILVFFLLATAGGTCKFILYS